MIYTCERTPTRSRPKRFHRKLPADDCKMTSLRTVITCWSPPAKAYYCLRAGAVRCIQAKFREGRRSSWPIDLILPLIPLALHDVRVKAGAVPERRILLPIRAFAGRSGCSAVLTDQSGDGPSRQRSANAFALGDRTGVLMTRHTTGGEHLIKRSGRTYRHGPG